MRIIRSDIGDRMPENKKDKKNKRDVNNRTPENNEGDPFKKIEDKLETYFSLVKEISKKNPSFKKLEEDLGYLVVMNSYLSEGIIKADKKGMETYNHVIADIEENFNFIPKDLIKDLKDLKEQIFKNVKNDVEKIKRDREDRTPENKKNQ